jgi:hypothetical protein
MTETNADSYRTWIMNWNFKHDNLNPKYTSPDYINSLRQYTELKTDKHSEACKIKL